MAPAEKFGASLPTTSAGEVRGGFLHAGLQHLDRVAADRVHLRVELDARARRRRGRPGWRRRSSGRRAARSLADLQDLQIRRRPAARRRRGTDSRPGSERSPTSGGSGCRHWRRRAPRARRSRPRSRTARAPSRSPTASRDRRRRSSTRCPARRARCRRSVGAKRRRAGTRRPCPCRGTASLMRSPTSSIDRAASSAGSCADCFGRYSSVAGSSVRISVPPLSLRACRSPGPAFSPIHPQSSARRAAAR